MALSPRADEVVFCIHSTGTSPFMWGALSESDVGGRTLVAPPNLGYPPGPSVARGTTVTLEDEVAHVFAQVPDGKRVHLVAHSYGGVVALRMLPRLGERVASLFLVEPVTFGSLAKDNGSPADAVAQARSFLEEPAFLHDEATGGGEAWLEQFIDYWNRPGSWQRMPEPLREMTRAVGWKMFQEVRACFAEDTPFDAWVLEVPTTLVLGERTTVASRAMTHALARSRPNVTLVEVAGVGHMAPLTHPAKIAAELKLHLERASR